MDYESQAKTNRKNCGGFILLQILLLSDAACFRKEEITLNKEVHDEIDDNKDNNNNDSDFSQILKYVGLSLVLLFKMYAFMHINQNNPSDQSNSSDDKSSLMQTNQDNPSDQSNSSDDKSSVPEKVDTTIKKAVEKKRSEKFHASFYSHTGWGHVIIDVLIYLFLAALFLLVSFKLIGALWNIKVVSRTLKTETPQILSNNRIRSWITQLFGNH